MTIHSVHWHEGMFLWPQHVQLGERLLTDQLQHGHRWDVHYNWGLRMLDLDQSALANYQFEVRALEARMRDGTLVALPENGRLGALDLKEAFGRDNRAIVYLGIPQYRPGSANVPGSDSDRPPTEGDQPAGSVPTRYLVEPIELEDENSEDEPQPTQVRLLNVRLLHSNQDRTGYDVLELARIVKAADADAVPELDETYIPPLLACDAWKPLQDNILQATYHYLGKKIEKLANQAATRGISLETRNAGDALIIALLHHLNEGYALLHINAFAEGIHPLPAYLELCRLVGQLAIFCDPKRVPELPAYDHDDLGECFFRVKQYIEAVPIPEPNYEEAPFIGEERRMQVQLDPKWLEPNWDLYVGVHSSLLREEVIRLLTRQGLLDMKIGSGSTVDAIFERGAAGLTFTAHATPPRALPSMPGLVFFQINRGAQQKEWDQVRATSTLAIRMNPSRIENKNADNTLQGLQTLKIKSGGQATDFQFTLFLTPTTS